MLVDVSGTTHMIFLKNWHFGIKPYNKRYNESGEDQQTWIQIRRLEKVQDIESTQ